MIFQTTLVNDVVIIEPELINDERGFFARTFCVDEFKKMGMKSNFIQSSISYNRQKGTLRGLHFQTAPFAETKLIRCTKGSIFDVVVDLRQDSASYKQWCSNVLSAENRKTLYVPQGVAHGFQCLEDDSEVFYQIDVIYWPQHASGLNYRDPEIHINWPREVTCISDRDRSLPLLKEINSKRLTEST